MFRLGSTLVIVKMFPGNADCAPVSAADFSDTGPDIIRPHGKAERLFIIFLLQIYFSHMLKQFRISRLYSHCPFEHDSSVIQAACPLGLMGLGYKFLNSRILQWENLYACAVLLGWLTYPRIDLPVILRDCGRGRTRAQDNCSRKHRQPTRPSTSHDFPLIHLF
jgi:hypothetical protein